ncbi:39S ribosomal protein L43, mitochondrial [Cephus cinctus]|uniref:Large ribosomal subunit protein mL43 n=1 Tax=Cephus cinctus TaxID=211228 RepID=A0AAJ7C682_CEPCN|nr:39S ribosomal protein L43, mitochondrial [Cephus cinctus]
MNKIITSVVENIRTFTDVTTVFFIGGALSHRDTAYPVIGMSTNKSLFLKAAFPRAPLNNGIGRYVCQLQRVTLKFCKNNGSSRGMRDFLENDLLNFANENPGVVVYVKPRRHKTPVIVAEYLNGDRFWHSCRNYSREELLKWMEHIRTQAGDMTNVRLRKMWHTSFPSIQGPWTPWTFKNPEHIFAQYPNKEFGQAVQYKPTATEELKRLFKEQQEAKAVQNLTSS